MWRLGQDGKLLVIGFYGHVILTVILSVFIASWILTKSVELGIV